MNTILFFEAGRARSGTALIPIIGTIDMTLLFSTRVGNTIINRGDGSADFSFTPLKNTIVGATLAGGINLSYPSAFTGNISIKFIKGLRDVYSISLGFFGFVHPNDTTSKYNITDLKSFFAQFSNLYSLYIDENASGIPTRQSVLKGDLSQLPDSVEQVSFRFLDFKNSATDLYLNFSNYNATSKLKSLLSGRTSGQTQLKILGDLGKLPATCQYLNIQGAIAGSSLSYTAGKVWASSFGTLYLPYGLLSATETDNVFIDIDNSVTTAIGGKFITLSYRTSASDSAVASLISKGYTVNCFRGSKILDLPFQNSFTDVSASALSVIAGNANGLPNFIADGFKPGQYSVQFNGSKSLKTSTNLPLNTSDKMSLMVHIKTTATAFQVIAELSINSNSNNSFGVFLNDQLANRIEILDKNSGFNVGNSSSNINTGNWIHVALVIDRALGVNQNSIYINGVLAYTQHAGFTSDNNGVFGAFILFIAQRAGASLGYVGEMAHLTITNYLVSPAEITAHKNR